VPTLALYAAPTDDRIVAYLQIAGGALAAGAVVRDCVILPAPTDAALLDQPFMAALEPFLTDDRSAQVVLHHDRATIHIGLSPSDTLVLDVDLAGTGRWRLGDAHGACAPAISQ
jgi:hypothetical protein